MKKFNIICYLPGHAGMFVQFLLSLHPTTLPHIPLVDYGKNDIDDSNDRHTLYSFKDAKAKFGNWGGHHARFNQRANDWQLSYFLLSSKYEHFTFGLHPNEFYTHEMFGSGIETKNQFIYSTLRDNRPLHNCSVNYFVLECTNVQDQVDAFIAANNGFPQIRPGELQLYSMYRKQFSPQVINLDNFLSDEGSFISEYHNLLNITGIPAQEDLALEFYKDWRAERNKVINNS